MINSHQFAQALLPAYEAHPSVGRGYYRSAEVGYDVQPLVQAHFPGKGIRLDSEAPADIAFDRIDRRGVVQEIFFLA